MGFYIVKKNGTRQRFKTHDEAKQWMKAHKDYPKGRHHIYNENTDSYANMKTRGVYWR